MGYDQLTADVIRENTKLKEEIAALKAENQQQANLQQQRRAAIARAMEDLTAYDQEIEL